MSRHGKCSLLSRRINLQLAIVTFAIGLAAAVAKAQDSSLSIYPSKGQTPEQQAKDKYECSQWAASQSRFNPGMPAPTTSTTANQPRGQVVRGAAAARLLEQLVVRLPATRAQAQLPARQWVEPLAESAATK